MKYEVYEGRKGNKKVEQRGTDDLTREIVKSVIKTAENE